MSSPDKVTKELADALVYMLQCWQEQFGEDACDCRPEPENFGHICQCCQAKVALESYQKRIVGYFHTESGWQPCVSGESVESIINEDYQSHPQ